jgi:DNA methylase/ParB-like nuclease domain
MANSSDAVPPPLAVTYCAVGTLRPDPRNARTHPKEQVDQIVASIRQFGFVNPILADPDERLMAAKAMGLAEVPTIYIAGLSEAQKRALRNAGMGSLYRSKHELVFVFKVGKVPHLNAVELGKHGRNRTNVWDYASVNSFKGSRREDLALHPTVKPSGLVADAIQDVTRRGDLVLDLFLGSGTTLVAAERVGRRFRGLDVDPAYVDVAIARWTSMTGGVPERAEGGAA